MDSSLDYYAMQRADTMQMPERPPENFIKETSERSYSISNMSMVSVDKDDYMK